MQFEFALTFEEWREAYAPISNPSKPAKRSSPAYQLVAWLGLFAYSVYSATSPVRVYGRPFPSPQNLWITLTPSLCMITFFVSGMITKALVARLNRGGKPLNQGSLLAAGLVSLLAYMWFMPFFFPQLQIDWNPDDRQKIWAALAPWFLYLAGTRYLSSRRLDGAMERLWKKGTSFKRHTAATISSNGVEMDDGYAVHRYRWAYFKRYRETENLVVLTTIDTGTIVFPKRAVLDDRAMDEMKMLISENIAEGAFIQRPQAFPVILATESSAVTTDK